MEKKALKHNARKIALEHKAMEKKALKHNARCKQEELDLSNNFIEAVPISSVQIPKIDMGTSVRATVVQASTIYYNTPATIDKASGLVSEAALKGAKLVVFPEAFIGGYPHESTFGGRSSKGTTEHLKYYDAAIDVPGSEVDAIAAIARKNNVFLIMGVIERALYTLYSTVLMFDPLGQYLGKHRKLIPTPQHLDIWGSGDELTIPTHETPIGKIGALISWENMVPLLRTTLYSKDIQIYCALSSDVKEVWQSSMKHIAFEGGCFVLSANQFCRKKDCPPPPDYEFSELDNEPSPDSIVCVGGSMIISPSGVVLAGPNYDGEALITADLDLSEFRKAKLEFDVVGAGNKLAFLPLSRKRRIHTELF